MICDVLSEAVGEIRGYQANSDSMYADLAQAINSVCEVMDALRHYLDTPPAPLLLGALQDLQAAIGQLDLSAVRAARQKVIADWRKAGPSPVLQASDRGDGKA